jgi:tRNA uridine 5-carboxymethylaminomethyl modification enzyme
MVAVNEECTDDKENDGMSDPSPASVCDTVEESVKYQSNVRRQHRDMESWRRAQGVRIPPDVVDDHDFLPIVESNECRIGQAGSRSTQEVFRGIPNQWNDPTEFDLSQSLIYLYHRI